MGCERSWRNLVFECSLASAFEGAESGSFSKKKSCSPKRTRRRLMSDCAVEAPNSHNDFDWDCVSWLPVGRVALVIIRYPVFVGVKLLLLRVMYAKTTTTLCVFKIRKLRGCKTVTTKAAIDALLVLCPD